MNIAYAAGVRASSSRKLVELVGCLLAFIDTGKTDREDLIGEIRSAWKEVK